MRCEEEGSISSQVYYTCPPHLDQIEEKLHEVYDKVEEILEAVQDSSDYEEEQGKKVDAVGREKIHDKRIQISMFECFSDPDSWWI